MGYHVVAAEIKADWFSRFDGEAPPKQPPSFGEFVTWPRKLEVIDVKNEEEAQVGMGIARRPSLARGSDAYLAHHGVAV